MDSKSSCVIVLKINVVAKYIIAANIMDKIVETLYGKMLQNILCDAKADSAHISPDMNGFTKIETKLIFTFAFLHKFLTAK